MEVMIIGCVDHKNATSYEWDKSFPNIEEFDVLIIDLTHFPKKGTEVLYDNISELEKATSTFMRTGREIFCIIDKPVRLTSMLEGVTIENYSWIPYFKNLSIYSRKKGKSQQVINKIFSKYFAFVEEWIYELHWKWVRGANFNYLAINKSGKPIAGTIDYGNGKIHLLPKTTKINVVNSVRLLFDIAIGKGMEEFPWRNTIQIPKLLEIEEKITSKKEKIRLIEEEIKNLEKEWKNQESYRDLFSRDDAKIPKAVQKIMFDFGIKTNETPKGHVVDLINEKIGIEVTSIKGKVNAKTKKITQLSRFNEEKTDEKIVFVANTYNELSIDDRINKEHITPTMEKFIESLKASFLTTQTLYEIWIKVMKNKMTSHEACTLIFNTNGVVRI